MTRPNTVHPELVEGGGRMVRQAHHERPHYDALFCNEVLDLKFVLGCHELKGLFQIPGSLKAFVKSQLIHR